MYVVRGCLGQPNVSILLNILIKWISLRCSNRSKTESKTFLRSVLLPFSRILLSFFSLLTISLFGITVLCFSLFYSIFNTKKKWISIIALWTLWFCLWLFKCFTFCIFKFALFSHLLQPFWWRPTLNKLPVLFSLPITD